MNDTSSKVKTFSLQYVTALTDELDEMRKEHAAEIDGIHKAYAAEIVEMDEVYAAKIDVMRMGYDEMRKEYDECLANKDVLIQKMQKAHAEELNKSIEDKIKDTLADYYKWYTRELDGFRKEAEAHEAELKNLKFTRAVTIGATMGIIIAAIAFCSESLIDYLPLMAIMAVPTLIFSYFCNKPQGKKNKSRCC